MRVFYAPPELKRLRALITEPPGSLRVRLGGPPKGRALRQELMDLLRSRGRGYIFQWSDPGPFLSDAKQVARKILPDRRR